MILDPNKYLNAETHDPIKQEDIETVLDAGLVRAQMANGNWWRVRRNGRTKRWKTRPEDFRIPIKMGFNSYGEITHRDLVS